jgi:hypothetical protein
MRYRRGRFVVDATRGRHGLRPATRRMVPPPPPLPEIDWEQAVRRIARIRVGQLGLVGAVGGLSVAGPVALAALQASHAREVLTAVAASAAAALAGWLALDRRLRRVVDGLGRSARALEGDERRAQFCPDAVDALARLWDPGALAPDDAGEAGPLGDARLQYRGVAADGIGRRRERPPVPGAQLVYRGRMIREAPPRA